MRLGGRALQDPRLTRNSLSPGLHLISRQGIPENGHLVCLIAMVYITRKEALGY